jgi:hypothetical protein
MAISRSSLIVALGAPALAGGCFALFSLDEYGPSGGGDAGTILDANGDANDAGVGDATKPPRLLFVTSETFSGSMAGVGGADGLCTAIAADAGLDGSFVAWLGAGTNGPASRIPDPQRQIVYPNDVVVAGNLAELAEAGPRTPIVVTEAKEMLNVATDCADDCVWTNARANGTVPPDGGFDCASWSTSTGGGAAGQLGGAHDEWTDGCGVRPCTTRAHLYCFAK